MVCIFFGDERTEYPLVDIQSMSAHDLIEHVTKKPTDEYSFLTFCGDRLSSTDLLSSLADLDDDDVLRVVCSEPPLTPTFSHAVSKVDECRKMLNTLNASHMVYAMSSLMEAMFDPDFLKKQIEYMPELRRDSEACQVLSDYFLMNAYLMEDNEKANTWLAEHPTFVEASHCLLTKHLNAIPRNSSFMQQNQAMQLHQQRSQQQAPQLISAEQLQAAMRAAFGQMAGASVAANPLAPSSQAISPQPTVVSSVERFSPELAQLREFGFMDDVQNLTILESTDGNVEMALELLITMREEDM